MNAKFKTNGKINTKKFFEYINISNPIVFYAKKYIFILNQ